MGYAVNSRPVRLSPIALWSVWTLISRTWLLNFLLYLEVVECLVPGEGVELTASGPRGMRFEASWTVNYIDPSIAQERHAALERRVRGECAIDEGQHDDGYAEPDSFCEDSQG